MVSPLNSLKMGVGSNSLQIYSQCSIAGTNNGSTKNSYFEISYDNTVLDIQNGSTCLSSSRNGTTSTCALAIPSNVAMANNSILVTKISQGIPLNVILLNTSLKITSWSYFSTLGQFFAICSSILNVEVVPQSLNPITSLVSCNPMVGQSNSLTFQIDV